MLQLEDLLAARLVDRNHPALRDALLASLRALDEGDRPRGLLAELVATGVIDTAEAERTAEEVRLSRRRRAFALLSHAAVAGGGDPERVAALHDRLVAAGAAADFEQGLVAEVGLEPESARAISFRARRALDLEAQRFLDEHRRARATGSRPSTDAPSEDEVGESVARLDSSSLLAVIARASRRDEGDAESVDQLLGDALSDTAGGAPPAFAIPSWVDTSDARTGSDLAGHRILGRIGAGATGVVYLADHPRAPERAVALKVLREELRHQEARFRREVVATSTFSHPGVIEVFDAGRTLAGEPWLAMEFFDSEDLAEVLETEGRLDPVRAIPLVVQLVEALAAVHEAGVVHADVKPENLLVSLDGRRSKLLDFGSALIRGLSPEAEANLDQRAPGELRGTPMYMSPELASDDAARVGPASDLYSVGLLLYRSLSGRLPFEADNTWGWLTCHRLEAPLSLASAHPACRNLPRALLEVVARLLEKDPAARPDHAAVVRALRAAHESLASDSSGRWLFGQIGKRRG